MSETGLFGMENGENMLTTQVRTYQEGIGAVCPTGEVSDIELANEVHRNQEPLQDLAKVCIDEREALDGQPVRAKMAGGNITTGFVAAELAGWALYTDDQRDAPVEQRLTAVADHLTSAGEVLGAHEDNHATDALSNCGAADGVPRHVGVIAAHGQDEQFIAQMRDVLGENFDQTIWSNVVTNAADSSFDGWSGKMVINSVKAHGGVVEILNGDNKNPNKDPDNKRHNHWAEGVVINSAPGMSNNRDGARVPHFQVDAPAIIETCQRMVSSEDEFPHLLHAAVGFQFAVRYNLTSGQRNIII